MQIFSIQCVLKDKDKENTDDEITHGGAKGGKVKRTASQKNLTSRSDDNDAASPKPKAGTIGEKAKRI